MRSVPGRMSATSPSSRKITSRVNGSSAETSEATKVSPSPDAHDERGARAGGDEPAWLVAVHEDDRVEALELRHRLPHRREQVPVPQMRPTRWATTSVSVSVTNGHPSATRRAFRDEVVLDDAVVDDDDPSRTVLVRVRVLLARAAVGRPTRVPDRRHADGAGSARQAFLEVAELPGGAPTVDVPAAASDRHARRIVAAVLQPPQALEQDRDRLPVSRCSRRCRT